MENNLNSEMPQNDLSSLETRWLNDKFDQEYKEKYTKILSNMDVRRELDQKHKSIRRKSNNTFFLKIAASLLFLVAIALFCIIPPVHDASHYAQSRITEKFEYAPNRSADKDNLLEAYQNGEYQKCIAIINDTEANKEEEDLYLLGVCHNYSTPPNYMLAKNAFEQIIAKGKKSDFYKDASLNLAAICFKLDDLEKAKKYLEVVKNDETYRKKDFANDFFESIN